ncbi:7-cyano-7-deazaguanine synthase [uncultured Amaricoccus sp.]|uniref:7-cyano-7-deazaguanine synthase n=1 Tax=uncultured Amaricoccus sp. TaxID=339341 RepID=UPI002601969F|nr:7-cyano-7-deazaguanine synthase [uncultured Amaricoccus sp.]
MDLLLHRKQFVIARRPVAVDPSWISVPLAEGWILSYQQDLPVEVDRRVPDAPEVLIGARLCADPATGCGAGRYARVRWPRVSGDAAALLGLHVGRSGGEFVVASSPAIAMLALTGEIPPFDIDDPLAHPGNGNYLPSPGTRWRAVRRLFCDQEIDLRTGAVEHADHGIRPLAGFDAARDVAATELARFAEELKSRIPGTVFLPLTAGLDSRTVAAAFLAAGLRFETVTFRYMGKPVTDVRIAAAISRRFGLTHHILDLEPARPGIAALVEQHTCGAVLGWDIKELIPGNAYRYQRPGDAMIAAGCFELGRQYFARYFSGLDCSSPDFPAALGAEIFARDAFTPFLADWRDWRGAHPEGLDWINAFYLDQRLGGWRAALEQGYDLLPALVLNPANNARVYSALVTPEPAEQADGRLQKAMIARLEPRLARFPVNPPTLGARLWRMRRSLARHLGPVLGRTG